MRPPPPRSARGVAAVELAVVLILLSTLVFGTIEIGRALYHYDVLAKSVRATSRYLVMNRPMDASSVPAWKAVGQCLAVYGKPNCSDADTPLIDGLTTGLVSISEPSTDPALKNIQTGEGTLDIVSVTIAGYPFRPVASFVVQDITFGAITAVMPYVYF